jgi:outer membrane lipoprotein-sorting protein
MKAGSFSMRQGRRLGLTGVACCLALLGSSTAKAQQPDAQAAVQSTDQAAVIRRIDAAVHARVDSVEGYLVTEHYAVFRGDDEVHPAAEMTVKTLYRRETGKTYIIQSESGSELLRKLVLHKILENEKEINLPGNVESAWITSANYQMSLRPGGAQRLDGKDCYVLDIAPKRKAPNLLDGTLWVDAKDGSILQIQGVASKSVSVFSGPTQMRRQYAMVSGFSMATHARAVAESSLFGRTVVKIDYRDYGIQLVPDK